MEAKWGHSGSQSAATDRCPRGVVGFRGFITHPAFVITFLAVSDLVAFHKGVPEEAYAGVIRNR